MQTVGVELRGLSPLLMNKMSDFALRRMREGAPPGFFYDENRKLIMSLPRAMAERERQARERERPLEEWAAEEADEKVYALPNGDPCVPRPMFMSCLISAGAYFKLTDGRQVSTARSSLVPGLLHIENNEDFPLLDPDTLEPAKWEVDIHQGSNPNGGEGFCFVRPSFNKWMFRCRITIDDEKFSPIAARKMFDIAGSRVGIGDYRPQKKGKFGKFEVLSWETVQETNAAKAGCGS